eukprot:6740185-Pyramimonas_sp.AAC.1
MILAFKVQETHEREDLDAGDRLGKISFTLNPTPRLQAKLATHEVWGTGHGSSEGARGAQAETAITTGL